MILIELRFYDINDLVIGVKQKEYKGDNPEKHAYKWAAQLCENYIKDIHRLSIEIYNDGEPMFFMEFTPDVFIKDELYYNIRRILDRYDVGDDISPQSAITMMKNELKRYTKNRKYLEE
jgi:hypothetical protein